MSTNACWHDPITDRSEELTRLALVRDIVDRAVIGRYAGSVEYLVRDLVEALDGPAATDEGH